MDHYHIWFNLKPGIKDIDFSKNLDAYLGKLKQDGNIVDFQLSKRKLGFGPSELGEYHLDIQVEDMAQLDAAFFAASERTAPIEPLHFAVNQYVTDFKAALYRNFPDPHRKEGEELF